MKPIFMNALVILAAFPVLAQSGPGSSSNDIAAVPETYAAVATCEVTSIQCPRGGQDCYFAKEVTIRQYTGDDQTKRFKGFVGIQHQDNFVTDSEVQVIESDQEYAIKSASPEESIFEDFQIPRGANTSTEMSVVLFRDQRSALLQLNCQATTPVDIFKKVAPLGLTAGTAKDFNFSVEFNNLDLESIEANMTEESKTSDAGYVCFTHGKLYAQYELLKNMLNGISQDLIFNFPERDDFLQTLNLLGPAERLYTTTRCQNLLEADIDTAKSMLVEQMQSQAQLIEASRKMQTLVEGLQSFTE